MKILYFDVCALILLGIMIISNHTRDLDKGRTNRLFMLIMTFALFSCIGDLRSAQLELCEPTPLRHGMMYFENYLYFFTHSNTALLFLMFSMSSIGVWHVVKKMRFVQYLVAICTIIVNINIVANFFNHKLFYITDDMKYVRGPMILVSYVCMLIIVVASAVLLLKFRKLVEKDKFIVLISILPLTLIAVLVQGIWPNVLIEMFVLASEIAVFVIVVQRQDEAKDPVSGAKKYNAGVNKLKQIMYTKTPVSIVLVKVLNDRNLRVLLGQEKFNGFIHDTTLSLKKMAYDNKFNAEVFYLEYGLFALMGENPHENNVVDTANEIKTYFQYGIENDTEIYAEAKICIVNCPNDIDEYSTLLTFGTSFYNVIPDTKDVVFYRDYVYDHEFNVKNQLTEIIKRGIQNNNLKLYFQPIYSVETKKFVAAEALIRMRDDKYGDISPSLFIPAAESSGDIHVIGDFVLDSVCKFIAEKKPQQFGIECVQINLSASQCIETDLAGKIKNCLEKYKVSPSMLKVEITESSANIDTDIVDKNVFELHNNGIQIILDDYGTGYSNMKRLIKLPIDVIKFDQKFVENIEDPSMQIVIEDSVKMLRDMGKHVLIEGIENENLAQKFISYGCDYIQGAEYVQGFYICRPLAEEDFMGFIERYSSGYEMRYGKVN